MAPLRRLWQNWLAYLEARRRYHRDDAREIAVNNLRTLNKVTPLTFLLLAVFLLATPYILPGWRPSVWHLAFVPVSILLAAITFLYSWKGKESRRAAVALCVVYEVVLFAGIIAIDAPGTSDAPGSFLSMLCVIMPVLFTLPFWLTFALIGLAVIAFCAMTMAFKPLSIARYDVFEAIVAVFFALAVDALTTALRIRDYEARVKYKLLSTRDVFSDIFNKRACKDAMVNYLQASAPRTRCAFLILDLDDFKRINDTAGHLGGDAILRRTGNMLQKLFRSSDVIGRFGGDEFVVLAKGMASLDGVERKCCRLREQMASFRVDGAKDGVTCSVGAVVVDNQAADYNSLFRQADAALYEAKKNGKNTHVIRRYEGRPAAK